MTTIYEGQHKAEFLVTEANGTLSRETITVLAGQNLQPGHIVGKVGAGTAAAAPVSGNAGNGAINAVTSGLGAKAGIYTAIAIEPGANAGTFEVEDPDGVIVGTAIVGTPFIGPVNFTIADGTTDFIAGDRFKITVQAGSGKYKEYNPANTDGSQVAAAILLDYVNATTGDQPAVIIARHAEVNAAELVWFAGADDNQKAIAFNQLKAVNIVGR